MKHKSFAILLLVILLITSSGSALAQGSTPPAGSDISEALPKSEFISPDTDIQAIPSGRDAGPAAATPPLVNGSFEQGPNVGWSELSTQGWPVVVPGNMLPVPSHSGNWAVWLGGDYNEHAYINQAVTLPGPSSLRLFYWIASMGPCGLHDRAYIVIYDHDTSNLKDVHTWDLCSANNTNGWVALDIDLSEYGAKSISIAIVTTTDGQNNSNFFIDDVSLYNTFADVSYDYWAESFIQNIYDAGITGGCSANPSLYCTETPVTRDQMAVFLLRGIHGSSYFPPATAGNTGFADVGSTYWSAAWIKQLAAEGITGGCGAEIYCPQAPVTRAQMAVFLLRAKYGAGYTPPTVGSSTGFGDVPTEYWSAAWIKQLVTEGITAGCSTGNYCPESPVTRAQMAVFLVRTFSLP